MRDKVHYLGRVVAADGEGHNELAKRRRHERKPGKIVRRIPATGQATLPGEDVIYLDQERRDATIFSRDREIISRVSTCRGRSCSLHAAAIWRDCSACPMAILCARTAKMPISKPDVYRHPSMARHAHSDVSW